MTSLLQQGIDAFQAGRFETALECFRRLAEQEPANLAAWNALGNVEAQLGHDDAAQAAYAQALRLNPRVAELHYNLAGTLLRRGRFQEAETAYLEAIRLTPGYADAYNNLGNLAWRQNRLPQAADAYRRAISLQPGNPEYHYNLGIVFKDQGDLKQANNAFLQALSLRPAYAEAWNNLGLVLHLLGDPEKASLCFQRAIALDANDPQYHDNLGTACLQLRQHTGAETSYRRALGLAPDSPEIRLHLGLALLGQGRWKEGWPFYESRRAGRADPLDGQVPAWDGEPLAGRRLLLWAEQGYGDSLMMFRFAGRLAAAGAKVTLLAPPGLVSLLQRNAGGVAILPNVGTKPAAGDFDFHCPLMSLPGCLGLDPADVAASPYLAARPLPRPDSLATPGLHVGIAWAGSSGYAGDQFRSLPHFRPLARLLELPGVHLHSLLKGPREDECQEFGVPQPAKSFGDFDDAAAFVQHLDLVISVDTATAHLAGALGRPTWLLLPYHSEWRWYPYGETTPWYPSARLFIQEAVGDWDGVIRRVAQALMDGRLMR